MEFVRSHAEAILESFIAGTDVDKLCSKRLPGSVDTCIQAEWTQVYSYQTSSNLDDGPDRNAG